MSEPYVVAHPATAVEPPEAGTLSRTLHADDRVKVVAFGFARGEELSEHTASKPAILHVLSGEIELVLGGDPVPAPAGTWVHMAAGLPHAVRAVTPAVMLLTLLKG
ncbi:MAG: cupin domain-containing protein [Thermoleophilia bacterium]|jgi:quercetin dioxygenase-like cupin family protein|nr:cupin domain-containing protein [Thermoleophilia bacterium]